MHALLPHGDALCEAFVVCHVSPLQRRIEQREERSSAAHTAPASSNWSKETFSFWLKKHLQQPDPGHRSKATRESPHFATVGSHGAVSSSAVSETVRSRSRSVVMLAQELYVHVCLMRYRFKYIGVVLWV